MQNKTLYGDELKQTDPKGEGVYIVIVCTASIKEYSLIKTSRVQLCKYIDWQA